MVIGCLGVDHRVERFFILSHFRGWFFSDLRFTIWLFPHNVGIRKAQRAYMEMLPVGSEVLVKVFLAHSLLPGFLSNRGPILGGNGGQGPAEMPGKFLGPDEILRGLLRFN